MPEKHHSDSLGWVFLVSCCVQVQGALAYAAGGGERPAQKKPAGGPEHPRRATAAVTGGPAERHRGPQ